MNKYLLLICLLLSESVIYAQSSKSDSLFAQGVELYNTGKYKEAIPIFAESDRLDKVELDSASNRREYSAMWLASCYYKIGDTIMAKSLSIYYKDKPIDRRLTFKSDSLITTDSSVSTQIKCAEIERKMLGDTNYWYGNTLINILQDYYTLKEYDKIEQIIDRLVPVFKNNETWAYDHFGIMIVVFGSLYETYKVDLQKQIRISRKIYEIAKLFFDVPYKDTYDGFGGAIVSLTMKSLANNNHLEEAIKLGEEARELLSSPIPIWNKNRSRVLSDLGTLYGKGSLEYDRQIDSSLSFNIKAKRWPVYEELEQVINKTEGIYSFDWANLQVKRSNFFFMHEGNRDLEKTREYLHKAFDSYSKQKRDTIERNAYLYLLYEQSPIFGYINDEQSYIDYAYSILSPDTVANYENKIIWGSIASKMNSLSLNRRSEAIGIYSKLFDDAINKNDSNFAISTLKDKALAEYLNHQYDDAVNDYIKLNNLIDSNLVNTKNYSPTDHAEIYHDIASCYHKYHLNNSALFNKYRDIAIQIKEKAILSKNNAREDYTIANIYDDYKTIGEWVEETYDGFDRQSFQKSIHYYKKASDILHGFVSSSSPQQESIIQSSLKDELASIYNRIAMRYTYLYDFQNADAFLQKVAQLCPDTLSYNYINAINGYARLFDIVSIEPELSLDYYYKHVSLLEERFRKMMNKLLPEELITETEVLIHNWEKCAEKYEYLGNNEKALECLDRKLELMKDQGSEYYSQEKLSRMRKELELYSPKATHHKLVGGEYNRANRNDNGDFEICKKIADEIALYYAENLMPLTAEKYKDIYHCYSIYTNDSLSTNKYLHEMIDAIKQEHPSDYMFVDDYSDALKYVAMKKGKDSVLQFYLQQMKLFSSNEGEKERYTLTLGDIASQYSSMNMPDSALFYAKLYIENAQRLGKEIEEDAIATSVWIAEKAKKYDFIVPFYEHYLNIVKKTLLKRFKYETAEEREKSWSSYEFVPFSCAEMLNKNFNACIPETTLYNNLLFRKGILLNTSISSANLIMAQGDSLLIQKYNRMQRLKKVLELNTQLVRDNGKIMTREQAQKIVARFDSEIMERAAMLGDYTSMLTCSWQDVQSSLKSGEIAVEFTTFPVSESCELYAALVLRSSGMPEYIELFDSDSLKKHNVYESQIIYNLVWKPIIQKVGNVNQIFFSADGNLHNIAIESVPWNVDGNNVKPLLTRLSSTRVLTSHYSPAKMKDAVIFGGIKYDTSTDVLVADSRRFPSNTRSLEDFIIVDSLNLRGGVAYLPATKEEVSEINIMLSDKNIGVTFLTDTLATEGFLKSLSGRKTDVLHIATHGFYWTEKEAKYRNDLGFIKGSSVSESVEDKSLTRSGLLFAGANNALTGRRIPEGVDDGIVTAKEISQLDLRGLDLVVLSACQTGLGEIKGDGVFGLQRGFKKAGAKTLLMSLWKVDDNATQLLMTQFYKNLSSGKSKQESLIQAQKYVREYEVEVEVKSDARPSVSAHAKEQAQQNASREKTYKKAKKYQDPYYWAAFILLDALD